MNQDNPRPRYADPADVERLADQWTEAQLSCRLYGHVWRPLRATYHRDFRYYYTVQLCPRCKTERHAELTARGHVASSWMRYADGYLAEKIGRIVGDGKDTLRLAALTRIYDVETVTGDAPHNKTATELAEGK